MLKKNNATHCNNVKQYQHEYEVSKAYLTSTSTLPLAHWPKADRQAWLDARRPSRRFKKGGRAGHLKASTATSMERAYGYLLAFLKQIGELDELFDQVPASSISPDKITAFLEELDHRIGSVTRHTYLQRIHAMARLLAPKKDWSWLGEIVLDLKDNARPRSKTARIVSSERLLQFGLDLVERAKQANGQTLLQRARLHRNGLMIALLSLCPIRLRNLAELELGKQLVEEEGAWWIRLGAHETKTGRPDERPIPPILSTAISDWIHNWKPLFYESSKRLWASTKGGGLAYTYVGTIITETTQKELGIPVNPHLFRDCAVYTIAHNAGHEMGTASALLQHTDHRVTEKHYNRGRSIEAVRNFHNILDQLPSK